MCCLQDICLKIVKECIYSGTEKLIGKNINQKKSDVAIFLLCKIDFMRNLIREKADHNIMVKGYMLKENIIILKVFVPNNIT